LKSLELIESGRFLGEEFILWLWHLGLTEGGTSGKDGDTSAWFVEDSIQLVSDRGDVKAISLQKGNPAESREAFEALSRGMRPYRAKMRLLNSDMEFTFTLTAPTLDLSGLSLPPGHSKDPKGRLADRIFLLEEFIGHLESRFKLFLEERSSDPKALAAKLKIWIKQGISGPSTGVPWES